MLEYRSDYFNDRNALASFLRYARAMFRLDFGPWRGKGLWDANYIAFSAFERDECVASICVYPSAMMVDGRKKTGAQLLTVGTLPEYRLRGIQRELWRRASEWIDARCDFAFLFTDESAAGFYEKLGFRRLDEHSFVITAPAVGFDAVRRMRRLDPGNGDDWAILERLARDRQLVSRRLGFHNPNLLLFMVLYRFAPYCYFVEDPEAIIVAEKRGERLRIHDIIAEETPPFERIARFCGPFGAKFVEFRFCPDRMGVVPRISERVTENLLFASDEFRLGGAFMFPSSIRA